MMQNLSVEVSMSWLLMGVGLLVIICLLEVDNIGRDIVCQKVIKPFVKTCVAILTCDVSGLHHRMFWVAHGTHQRKMPRKEFGLSSAVRLPRGQTHAQHQKV